MWALFTNNINMLYVIRENKLVVRTNLVVDIVQITKLTPMELLIMSFAIAMHVSTSPH